MCPYCSSHCINHGTSNTGNKRYRCKTCKRTHSKRHFLTACRSNISYKIKNLLKEGCGIRSIARLLKISVTTVMKRILMIANKIGKPLINFGKEYELDEMCTYVISVRRENVG